MECIKQLVDTTNLSKYRIIWKKVATLLLFHVFSFQAIYYMATLKVSWKTVFWGYFLNLLSRLGTTAGVHRLWSHRCYKAKLPLKVMLCLFQTMSFQGSIVRWSRDHRLHHKYTDTDADPHNAARGFFFSHIGWLMVRKHPEVIEKLKSIDVNDLRMDPVVRFQEKYYLILAFLFCFLVPTLIPWYFWGEDLYTAFCVAGMLKFMLTLHTTSLVNSAAHKWGNRPYDRHIRARENRLVTLLTAGEGWHNYHHTFPWDYKSDELGNYSGNLTTGLIDLMAKIGWAYDLKTVEPELILKRKERTGNHQNDEG